MQYLTGLKVYIFKALEDGRDQKCQQRNFNQQRRGEFSERDSDLKHCFYKKKEATQTPRSSISDIYR